MVLFLLSTLLWIGIALWSKFYLLCVVAHFCLLITFLVVRKVCEPQKAATVLLPAKFILTISFFGCVALCLKSYQESIACTSCIQSYLSSVIEPSFYDNLGQNLKSIWTMYPRFIVIMGLFLLWSAAFAFSQRKKEEHK